MLDHGSSCLLLVRFIFSGGYHTNGWKDNFPLVPEEYRDEPGATRPRQGTPNDASFISPVKRMTPRAPSPPDGFKYPKRRGFERLGICGRHTRYLLPLYICHCGNLCVCSLESNERATQNEARHGPKHPAALPSDPQFRATASAKLHGGMSGCRAG